MLKRLGYGFYAAALQQFGGIAALTMYAALIYESLGWNDGRQALALNGIQASLQLVIVLVNTFTVELVLSSSSCTAIVLTRVTANTAERRY